MGRCDGLARAVVARPVLVLVGALTAVVLVSALPFIVGLELVVDLGTDAFETRGTQIGDWETARGAISRFMREQVAASPPRRQLSGLSGLLSGMEGVNQLSKGSLGLDWRSRHAARDVPPAPARPAGGRVLLGSGNDTACPAALDACFVARGANDTLCSSVLAKGRLCVERDPEPLRCLSLVDELAGSGSGPSGVVECLRSAAVAAAPAEVFHRDVVVAVWSAKGATVLDEARLAQALAVEQLVARLMREGKTCAAPSASDEQGDLSPACAAWAAQGNACASSVALMNRLCRASCGTRAAAQARLATRAAGDACAPPLSVLPAFFPSYPSAAGALGGADLLVAVHGLALLSDRLEAEPYSGWPEFMDKYFSSCNASSQVLRFGLRFSASSADGFTQESFYAWRMSMFATVHAQVASIAPDLQFVHFDHENLDEQKNALLVGDALLVLVVMLVNLLLMWLHTRSLFVSSVSMLCVLVSFPLTLVVYRVVLNIKWVGVLQGLSLFILAGLGVDNTFVLHDGWVQSAALFGRSSSSYERRMRWTLRRTSYGMWTTSATTAASFFTNAVSAIAPLRCFGVWTGLLVLWNVLLTCTVLPAAIIISERYSCCYGDARGSSSVAPSRAGKQHQHQQQQQQQEQQEGTSDASASASAGTSAATPAGKTPGLASAIIGDEPGHLDGKAQVNELLDNMRPAERFFVTTYHAVMVRRAGAVAVASCALLAACVNIGVWVQPMQENPALFPTTALVGAMQYVEENLLPVTLYPLPVYLSFGILPGQTGYSMDPSTRSDVLWDAGFDASSPAAQEHAAYVCDRLLDSSDMVRMVVSCFWYDFRAFCLERGAGFPVPQERFRAMLLAFNSSTGGAEYVRNRQLLVGEDGTLRFFQLMVMSTLDQSSLYDLAKVGAMLEQWEQWVARRNAEWAARKRGQHDCSAVKHLATIGPASALAEALAACGLAPLTPADFDGAGRAMLGAEAFALYDVITSLQTMGKASMLASWVCASLLVAFATNNWWLGLFAALSFALTIFETLALMVLGGFTVGVLESIVLSILVGLSSDYTVHLSNAYAEAPSRLSSLDRAQFAISHLGITVLFGAVTTIVSGLVLFCATIIFFRVFGWFIVAVILLSLANTVGMFAALAYWWGPSGEQGAVWVSTKRREKLEREQQQSRKSMSPNLDQFLHSLSPNMDDFVAPESRRRAAALCCAAAVVGIAVLVAKVVQAAGVVDPRLAAEAAAEAEAGAGPGALPGSVTLDLAFPRTTLTAARTQYLCAGFQFSDPDTPTAYVTRIDVKNAKPGVVHHIVAFRMLTSATKSCPFRCDDMPDATGVLFAWAVGADNLTLPEGMAIAVGGRSQTANIYVQTHYDNWREQGGEDPGSGLVFHGSHKKPDYLVTTFSVGFATNSPAVAIPPQQANFSLRTSCKPKLVGNVTALAFGHHAHKLGVHIKAWQYRGDELVGELGTVDPYDFNLQKFIFFPDAHRPVLQPGDRIEIECRYNSMHKTGTVFGGLSSEEEMCMTFLMAWPSENIIEPFCLTY